MSIYRLIPIYLKQQLIEINHLFTVLCLLLYLRIYMYYQPVVIPTVIYRSVPPDKLMPELMPERCARVHVAVKGMAILQVVILHGDHMRFWDMIWPQYHMIR